MPVVDATDLMKSFDERPVLAGVNLTLRRGERVGLVGNNGCGKSTLGRILGGIETADGGELARRRGTTVEVLSQEPVLAPDQSARQIVLDSLTAWSEARRRYDELIALLESGGASDEQSMDWISEQAEVGERLERLGGWDRMHEAEAIIRHLGIEDPTRLAGTMSGGERRRVALARVLVGSPDLAILDEPTNHLDVETIEWLEEYLVNRFPGALLLITHDRYVLDRVTDRTLEIHRGDLASYDGGYATYLAAKAERQAHEDRTESNRQNFLRRELEWLRRQPKARGTKQKARTARAENALAQSAPEAARTAALRVEGARQGNTILDIQDLRLERGGQLLVDGLTLAMTRGQRIGIVGPNGTGKSSLLACVLEELAPVAGSIVRGKNTRVGHLDQERSGLVATQTIYDSVAEERSEIELAGQSMSVGSYLERFLFDRSEQRAKVGQLSGGERARVCLAKLLCQPLNLLLLDEPTNDLDVGMLGALEAMLTEYAGSALIVSHDRWFLDRVATSILAFEGNGRVTLHAGNYSDYRARRDEARRTSSGSTTPAKPGKGKSAPESVSATPVTVAKKLSFKEKRELDGLLDAIEAAELEVTRLESELAAPETYKQGGEAVAELSAVLEGARGEAERLTSRWEELAGRDESGA